MEVNLEIIEGHFTTTLEEERHVGERQQQLADLTGHPINDYDEHGNVRGTAWPRSKSARAAMSDFGDNYERIFGHPEWKGDSKDLNA